MGTFVETMGPRLPGIHGRAISADIQQFSNCSLLLGICWSICTDWVTATCGGPGRMAVVLCGLPAPEDVVCYAAGAGHRLVVVPVE